MKIKELEEIISKKYDKYNNLLWYARSKPEHINQLYLEEVCVYGYTLWSIGYYIVLILKYNLF